ncbi:ATP-binding cassette domain-containing protein [Parvularcula flava]|uniref:ATP-binding cassette domain-containing protein n=1 Tax=Aquisalinus luteolus TaxID=1566827 RepID=A0A8J3A4S6_9PROT|nr:ATP-binding cassette domain-containing protein [Aquisalinus luteolus]NHK28902.1 ATP-binding cassette domain-containing protein [Aquisalinus luteolus]GGH99861.1 peptidase [Aquisalinus luteolus]
MKPGTGFAMAVFFTVIINTLMLVSPFYMLQVYDRIMTSGSIDTLLLISAIVIFLLVIYGLAEVGRRRVFALSGKVLGDQVNSAIFAAAMLKSQGGKAPGGGELQRSTSQLATVQSFLMNGSISSLYDVPFTPVFLLILFLVHPLLGIVATAGGAVLVMIAIASELATSKKLEEIRQDEADANQLLAHTGQQSIAILSMGLTQQLNRIWSGRQSKVTDKHVELLARSGALMGLSRSLRQILQAAILGVGAWLAIGQEISPGAIVAGSIIMGRALAPIDQCIGQWKQLIGARAAARKLRDMLPDGEQAMEVKPNPRPQPQMDLIDIGIGIPGTDSLLFSKFRYSIEAGQRLAVIGESGVGKTALIQTLSGVWKPQEGTVKLGGLNVHQWHSDDRGQYFGYCPQNVQLTAGTVAENIARYRDCELEDVVAAAEEVGAHERIMRLPNGYQTLIGAGGYELSAGQQQLVGLARAVFGNPVCIMLDEPTANLDEPSVKGFLNWLTSPANKERIVISVTHDIRCLSGFTDILHIHKGKPHLLPAKEYFARRNAQLAKVAGR